MHKMLTVFTVVPATILRLNFSAKIFSRERRRDPPRGTGNKERDVRRTEAQIDGNKMKGVELAT